MPYPFSRREFFYLSSIGALGTGPPNPLSEQSSTSASEGAPRTTWPQQDPAVVREFVGVCHGDLARVTELVERMPALAIAAVDWSFGDWEDGLGAAAHVGRREIAEVLLAHGARPSIFSAAMMGQLDVVRAFVDARPGVQRTLGPHGITLMAHARAGGKDAEAVVGYLEALGDADRRLTTVALDGKARDALAGRFVFGPGARDYVEVDVQNDQLGISRPGSTHRLLLHSGDLPFFPSGVPSVKITFARGGGRVTIADPSGLVTAIRQ